MHFIVFHTDKLRIKYRCVGSAIKGAGRKIVDWKGEVLGDNFDGNVDPLVITFPWFYSFCQGQKVLKYVQPGSIIFFASSEIAKKYSYLKIDTVFIVDKKIPWRYADKRKYYSTNSVEFWESLSFDQVVYDIQRSVLGLSKKHLKYLLLFHLLYGFKNAKTKKDKFTHPRILQSYYGSNQHTGKFTCTAKMINRHHANIGNYSFLPIDERTGTCPILNFPFPPTFTYSGNFINPIKISNHDANWILKQLNKHTKVVEIKSGDILYNF